MFHVNVSLSGGAGAFDHKLAGLDGAHMRKVDRALTDGLKHLNDKAELNANSASVGSQQDNSAKVDVTLAYEVTQDGAPFCTSRTTWHGVNATHQKILADAFAHVGTEAKAHAKPHKA